MGQFPRDSMFLEVESEFRIYNKDLLNKDAAMESLTIHHDPPSSVIESSPPSSMIIATTIIPRPPFIIHRPSSSAMIQHHHHRQGSLKQGFLKQGFLIVVIHHRRQLNKDFYNKDFQNKDSSSYWRIVIKVAEAWTAFPSVFSF